MSSPADLLGMDLAAMERALLDAGQKRFHARQIYHWIYARRARSFDVMTDLSLGMRQRLSCEHTIGVPVARQVQQSDDGTRKYLLAPPSGGEVESVFIPEDRRVTFCISPQIGCALDCGFCLTARIGFLRNLTAGEIVGQVLALLNDNQERIDGRPVNIVMMGMGEALHNYENTMAAVRLLVDPEGLAFPRRRITLSTAGLVPAILRLADEEIRPRLAVSLNATTDDVRSRLMPINRKYSLDTLLDACRGLPLGPRERVTFEYVLLAGVNDTPLDPPRLAALMNRHRLRAKVNLIPFNAGSGLPWTEPSAEDVRRFRDGLLSLGVSATIRKNRGRDISAACGQLALVGAEGALAGQPASSPTHN